MMSFPCETDYWAMGIIAHWCLFEEYPFGVKTSYDVDPIKDLEQCDAVDPSTGDLLRRVLDKSPFSRIKSPAMKRHPCFAGVGLDEICRRDNQGPFWDIIPENLRSPAVSTTPLVAGNPPRLMLRSKNLRIVRRESFRRPQRL